MTIQEAFQVFRENKGLPAKIKASGVIAESINDDCRLVNIRDFKNAVLQNAPITATGRAITDQKEFSADDIIELIDHFLI